MSKNSITRARLIDGKPYRILADGSLRPLEGRTDWKRVNALTDEEIEAAVALDPDAAPIADEAWFARARRAHPGKEQISIKLDSDVLAFFRWAGPRYQTRINNVLRAFMEHESAVSTRHSYHVVPHHEGWAVMRERSGKAASVHSTQREAIERAKAVARNQGSDVVIHRSDGRIRDQNTYGNDPLPPRGRSVSEAPPPAYRHLGKGTKKA